MPESNAPKGPSILVMEDDRLVQRVLKLQLGSRGFPVRCCADGATGVQWAIDERPQLIILDLMMPVMNGFDVLRSLRTDERTADIPVLVLTASHDTTHRSASRSADAFLTKPYSEEDLLREVELLLGAKSNV